MVFATAVMNDALERERGEENEEERQEENRKEKKQLMWMEISVWETEIKNGHDEARWYSIYGLTRTNFRHTCVGWTYFLNYRIEKNTTFSTTKVKNFFSHNMIVANDLVYIYVLKWENYIPEILSRLYLTPLDV